VTGATETCRQMGSERQIGLQGVNRRPKLARRITIKEVDDGIWLVSFMHYDLEYFDLEQKTLQPLDNPFGTRLSPMS
jgi:hypothetical protein